MTGKTGINGLNWTVKGIALLPALLLAGCGQGGTPSDSTAVHSQATSTGPQGREHRMLLPTHMAYSWDDQLADLARTHPAFAGYSVYGDELTVYVAKYHKGLLLPESERGRKVGHIRKALLTILASDTAPRLIRDGQAVDHGQLKVKIQDVKHSYADLQSWRLTLREKGLTLGLISGLSINTATNALTVTVPTPEARAAALQLLDTAGVDPDAVGDITVSRPVQQLSVRDQVRPPMGGIQIGWRSGLTGGDYVCSIGVNASYNVPNLGWKQGFLTASHCSTYQGVTGSTTYTNPAAVYTIAEESADTRKSDQAFCDANIEDPAHKSLPCQLADVLFATYSVSSTRGSIAKTFTSTSTATTYGSRTIVTDAAGNPTSYAVTATEGRVAEGTGLIKIGGTSGYTVATVIEDSEDVLQVDAEGNYLVLLNAERAESPSGAITTCGGDSGAPWFYPSGGNAVLVGLHSAGGDRITAPDGYKCDTYSLFTPMGNVYKVFGGSPTAETNLLVKR